MNTYRFLMLELNMQKNEDKTKVKNGEKMIKKYNQAMDEFCKKFSQFQNTEVHWIYGYNEIEFEYTREFINLLDFYKKYEHECIEVIAGMSIKDREKVIDVFKNLCNVDLTNDIAELCDSNTKQNICTEKLEIRKEQEEYEKD